MDFLTKLLLLSQMKQLGNIRIAQILYRDPFLEEFQCWKESDWSFIKSVSGNDLLQEKKRVFKDSKLLDCIEKSLAFADKTIALSDSNYPFLLKQCADAPIVLFCKGNADLLMHDYYIAIVGTRFPTVYGIDVSQYFSAQLAKENIITVSGFAKGIDTVAHKEAIRQGGKTIAVLGSGLNVIYPKENQKLYRELLETNQLIVSEFLYDSQPDAPNFPKRNRIIAGLSQGTLVVEAGKSSGALITADFALEYDREVFAVPGPIHSTLSIGPNELINKGAQMARTIDDILNCLHLHKKNINASQLEIFDMSENELTILNILSQKESDVDELIESSGLAINRLLQLLSQLEIKGYICQSQSGLYAKRTIA